METRALPDTEEDDDDNGSPVGETVAFLPPGSSSGAAAASANDASAPRDNYRFVYVVFFLLGSASTLRSSCIDLGSKS